LANIDQCKCPEVTVIAILQNYRKPENQWFVIARDHTGRGYFWCTL